MKHMKISKHKFHKFFIKDENGDICKNYGAASSQAMTSGSNADQTSTERRLTEDGVGLDLKNVSTIFNDCTIIIN